MLASRTTLFGASGTASARAAAKAATASGREIIDMTAGEIWSDLAPTLRAGAIAAVEEGVTRYSDTIGMVELRQAIAQSVSRESGCVFGADEVAVTTGAKQALFNATMVLLNPGDEVIIPAPYWTTFPAQTLLAGGTPVFVDCRAHGNVPRIEDLRSAVTPRTRAIIVNTPGNPSGAVWSADTLAAVAQLAIERNFWILFDECYGSFVWEPHVHHSIARLVPEARSRLLIVNAFSKQLAITGWRIGYLVAPPEVIRAVRALQSHTTSNPNVIAQHAVLAHLQKSDGSYETRLKRELGIARARGLEILSSLERVPPPTAHGGFYFYLDIASLLPRTADEIVNDLLVRAGVACVSGTAFGDPAGLRVSYGIPVDTLEVGLKRLVEGLSSLR